MCIFLKNTMFLPVLLERQHGIVPKYGICRPRLNLCHILERLTCTRLDEHHIDGHETGELIPPLACGFSKTDSSLLAVADEDGGVLIFNTDNEGLHAVTQSWRAHENAVFDIDWSPHDNHLLTASGDQSLILWDVGTEDAISYFRGHSSSVKTVRCRAQDKFVFASGSRDGHIMLWDRRVKGKEGHISPVNTIHNAHCVTQGPGSAAKKRRSKSSQAFDSQQSVTAVVFQDEHTLISSGSVDGSVKVWDLRKQYANLKTEAIPKHRFLYAGASIRSHGFSSLILDSTGTRLFASCMDNIIYQYNTASLQPGPVACYRGHLNHSFYVKTALSPDDMYLLSGSTDHNGYIWQVDAPLSSPLVLKGHTNEVSAVAWCPKDMTKLVTMSDDSCVRIWRALPGQRHPQAQPGDVVGTCECHSKEIGVGVSTVATSPRLRSTIRPLTSLLMSPQSPRPGSVLPMGQVPMLSPAFHSSLVAMGAGVYTSPSQNRSPRLVSPSITKWFSKSPRTPSKYLKSPSPVDMVGSPLKSPTPRKLHVMLSPRKFMNPSPQCNKENIHVPVPRKAAMEVSQEQGLEIKRRKRKLSETSPEDVRPVSKRAGLSHCNGSRSPLVGSLAHHNHVRPDGNTFSDSPLIGSPRTGGQDTAVLSSQENKSLPTKCQKKLEFGDNALPVSSRTRFGSPLKRCSSPQFQSPTVDLPNYVADPQPRTPVARRSEALRDSHSKTPDWLTQISIGMRSPDGKVHISEGSPCTPRSRGVVRISKAAEYVAASRDTSPAVVRSPATPCSTKRRRSMRDPPLRSSPRLAKTPTQGRRSILHYFSPNTRSSPRKTSPTDSPHRASPMKNTPVKSSPHKNSPRKNSPIKNSPLCLDSPVRQSPRKKPSPGRRLDL